MRGEILDRRFTNEETRRIFERAAEVEAHPQTSMSQDGHTLEELRAIAMEVGLDVAAVDRAAAEIAASASSSSERRRPRVSRLLHEDAVISRALSNDEMRKLMSQVEQIIGRRGLLSDAGAWVEWRDSRDRLYVGMVRGDQQTRLRAIANPSAEMVFGSAIIGVIGILLIPATGGSWLSVGAVLAVTLAAIGLFVQHRVAVTRRELRELLDILDDTAGT